MVYYLDESGIVDEDYSVLCCIYSKENIDLFDFVRKIKEDCGLKQPIKFNTLRKHDNANINKYFYIIDNVLNKINISCFIYYRKNNKSLGDVYSKFFSNCFDKNADFYIDRNATPKKNEKFSENEKDILLKNPDLKITFHNSMEELPIQIADLFAGIINCVKNKKTYKREAPQKIVEHLKHITRTENLLQCKLFNIIEYT